MEDVLKKELCLKSVEPLGGLASGGFINKGQSYLTDSGWKIFVKSNDQEHGGVMFNGEAASLNEISKTETIRVPKPLKVFQSSISNPGKKEWTFVMEHLEFSELKSHQRLLGEQIAKLHLHNLTLKDDTSVEGECVDKFGFHCTTCLGFIAMPNTWKNSWIDFYVENRLQVQVDLLEKEYRDEEIRCLWPQLRKKISLFFEGLEIFPSLLHGDLWSGNIGEDKEGPVVFDPASFYGHHEFDLIPGSFGGFTEEFYDAYHKLIPKAPGFDARHKLYLLFNYLNHWNHFGPKRYRDKSGGRCGFLGVCDVPMEELKRQLCLKTLKPLGGVSGGCISNGESYQTDTGKIFVKSNAKDEAGTMFKGEAASLRAILKTETIRVPRPLKVFQSSNGWVFAMEHLDISGLRRHQGLLGQNLARLHLHNATLKREREPLGQDYVDKFGFDCPTCCGFIAMPNTWKESWIDFYTENRLQIQINLLEKESHDQELLNLWPLLKTVYTKVS